MILPMAFLGLDPLVVVVTWYRLFWGSFLYRLFGDPFSYRISCGSFSTNGVFGGGFLMT